jgi:hypothetical protein
MTQQIIPVINKTYLMQRYAMLWIKKGNGLLQIDFKAYDTLEDKIIYLSPGQYIRFLTGTFEIWIKEFSSDTIIQTAEARVLFKHLISFGYIDNSQTIQQLFSAAPVLCGDESLLHQCVENWFLLNPFNARKEEYRIIFNLQDELDEQQVTAKKDYEKKIRATTNMTVMSINCFANNWASR